MARFVQGLGNLAKLGFRNTQVSDLTLLQGLGNLAELDFSGTQVSDLTPLQGLGNLASLSLRRTQVSDLTPLQGLGNLASLDLSGTQVSDLTPLQSLGNLAFFHLGNTQIRTFPDFVLELPNLHMLFLYGSPIHDVPTEIFGSSGSHNCLDAVRSHFADKAYGVALDREIKLILLGNGRVGKTSVVKRLVHNDFDPYEPSTHGIQLVPWDLPDHGDAIQINIWDFGGQDIYHGTHALFLSSRALFLLVWDRDSEHQSGYNEDGYFFEHFPLAYWIDYVQETSPDSPVLVIENKCDDGSGSEAPCVVPGSHLAFSAKEDIGREAVTGWIRETSRRELANLGARAIGIGRWQVKQTLLGYMEQDEARESAEREYRTISYAHFQQLCDTQAGRVSSAHELLRYLHQTGVVYYQKHLFNDQIILDQRWAIEAIYTIFHREKSYRQLKSRGGRFRPIDLHDLVWEGQFTQEEQRLFITFMESCGLCFRLSEWNEDDPEYLAPDLLPDNMDLSELDSRREKHGDDVLYYRYTQRFLHRDAMRCFMVEIGCMFRDRALYWKDGLCIDQPRSQAMAIIECKRGIDGNPSRGRITMEVRGRQRHNLLNRIRNTFEHLAARPEAMEQAVSLDGGANWIDVFDLEKARLTGKVISQQGQVLETQDFLFLLSKEPGDDLSKDTSYPREERSMPPSTTAVYISYAWGDHQEADASREDIVNRLYDALTHEGYNVKRDKMDLGYQGLISAFMKEIGQGDCIVVVISDKYLKSPFCMYELWGIYCNQEFHDRICPIVLADVKLRTAADRLKYVVYWKQERDQLGRLIEEAGLDVLSAEGGTLQEYDKYREITHHADKLLGYLADINSQTPQLIEANDFETLKRAIDERLQQLQ